MIWRVLVIFLSVPSPTPSASWNRLVVCSKNVNVDTFHPWL